MPGNILPAKLSIAWTRGSSVLSINAAPPPFPRETKCCTRLGPILNLFFAFQSTTTTTDTEEEGPASANQNHCTHEQLVKAACALQQIKGRNGLTKPPSPRRASVDQGKFTDIREGAVLHVRKSSDPVQSASLMNMSTVSEPPGGDQLDSVVEVARYSTYVPLPPESEIVVSRPPIPPSSQNATRSSSLPPSICQSPALPQDTSHSAEGDVMPLPVVVPSHGAQLLSQQQGMQPLMVQSTILPPQYYANVPPPPEHQHLIPVSPFPAGGGPFVVPMYDYFHTVPTCLSQEFPLAYYHPVAFLTSPQPPVQPEQAVSCCNCGSQGHTFDGCFCDAVQS